jgi:hypothetical protein
VGAPQICRRFEKDSEVEGSQDWCAEIICLKEGEQKINDLAQDQDPILKLQRAAPPQQRALAREDREEKREARAGAVSG